MTGTGIGNGNEGVRMSSTADGRERSSPRARPGWFAPVAWGVGILVALVVLFFVADAIVRTVAQNAVRDQIQQQLPADVTAKDLNVTIGGLSVIGQYLAGSFERVELDAPHVTANGIKARAKIVAYGIPTDLARPVERIQGTVTVAEGQVDSLVSIPGITDPHFRFTNKNVSVSGVAHLLGVPVKISADVHPSLAGGGFLSLAPSNVTVGAADANVDLTQVAQALIGGKSYAVCVAQYLPKGVRITDIGIGNGTATVSVGGAGIVLDEATLNSKGHCA